MPHWLRKINRSQSIQYAPQLPPRFKQTDRHTDRRPRETDSNDSTDQPGAERKEKHAGKAQVPRYVRDQEWNLSPATGQGSLRRGYLQIPSVNEDFITMQQKSSFLTSLSGFPITEQKNIPCKQEAKESGLLSHSCTGSPGVKPVCVSKASGCDSKARLVTRISMAFLSRRLGLLLTQVNRVVEQRHFSISGACSALQKLTRVRVVDNSALGNTPYHRPPKCIHVYNKTGVGKVGDKILLAIKGEKKKALIVGHRMPGPCMTPRFDSNNVVLIEDNGNPTGTRIKTPIPLILRKREGEFSKVLAIAQLLV
ncbi:39S ribosomal protein L14 [Chelonia mydas]|uniref:Large ribosomal subunit protein uL14m n=1 Tax=Chelonia mydas TaxID=8469 RepID=M7AXH5_CHEMY|nr:39S ribosomal protein L14 [Chelonia mydas]